MTEEIQESIAWAEARAVNRANWDDRAAVHATGYGLERFDDPNYLSSVVRDDLPVLLRHLPKNSLQGKDLAHLQCHIGSDSLSLARAGANVVGLDQSLASLTVARALAARHGARIPFVESDVMDARAALHGDFDVVYTSIGTICWLQDLNRWAEQIAALLRPGGVFYIRDGHPMLLSVDDALPGAQLRFRYFDTGPATRWDDTGTYAGDGTVEHARSYEWPHPLAEIIGAVLAAGLRLEHFGEGRTLPWRFCPQFEPVGEDSWQWPEALRDVVPCTFTLVARKPG